MFRRLLPAILLLATLASAQDRPAIYPPPNTIMVGADGVFQAEPDVAVFNFGVSAQETDSQAAYTRASRAVEQVRQVIKHNGLDPKTAEVGTLAIQPVYDYRSPKRKLLGYRVNTTITLRLKEPDFQKIGPITQQVSAADITDQQSFHYELENKDAAKNKALEIAMRKARSMADTVARAGGRILGDLSIATIDVSEGGPIYPMQMRTAMANAVEEAPAPPTEGFKAERIEISAHVNVTFTLK